MFKKVLKAVVLVITCIFTLTACNSLVSYYDRIDTVIKMSEDMLELYSDNIVSVGESINCDNISDYCSEEDELYKLLNSDNEYGNYSVVMVDEDKVLVRTDVIFYSVEGFLVNLGTDEISDTYNVPERLNYDNDKIDLVKTDQYDNVYTFRAGL